MHLIVFLNYLWIGKLIFITNDFTLHVLYCMLVLKHFSYTKLILTPGNDLKIFFFLWVLLSFKLFGSCRRNQVIRRELVSGSYLAVHFRAPVRCSDQSARPVWLSSMQGCSWERRTSVVLWEQARESCRLLSHSAGKVVCLHKVGSLHGERISRISPILSFFSFLCEIS